MTRAMIPARRFKTRAAGAQEVAEEAATVGGIPVGVTPAVVAVDTQVGVTPVAAIPAEVTQAAATLVAVIREAATPAVGDAEIWGATPKRTKSWSS